MKRYLNWVLGGLAAVTAVAALRPRPKPDIVADDTAAPSVVAAPSRWFDEPLSVGRAVVGRLRQHHMPMIAGSLSYYAFLAIFPAAIAAISIYRMVLDPADLATQIEEISEALPEATAAFINAQLTNLVVSSESGLGFAAVVSIVAALWSASAGTKALMTGIDIAYDTPEDRPFIILRGMALGITVGLIAFILAAVSAVTFLPDLLSSVGAGDLTRYVEYGRWPAIFILVVFGLGLLYKIAPNRPAANSPWVSVGAIAMAALWLLATLGFSLYANNADALGVTYGALAGIIVLLLWFFMSGLILLLGAELNAELEARGLAHEPSRVVRRTGGGGRIGSVGARGD
jgi:membrane protein